MTLLVGRASGRQRRPWWHTCGKLIDRARSDRARGCRRSAISQRRSASAGRPFAPACARWRLSAVVRSRRGSGTTFRKGRRHSRGSLAFSPRCTSSPSDDCRGAPHPGSRRGRAGRGACHARSARLTGGRSRQPLRLAARSAGVSRARHQFSPGDCRFVGQSDRGLAGRDGRVALL